MQKAKRLFSILVIVILASFFTPLFVAYADSPAPPSYFYSYATNTDSNVKYTDILIKISTSNKYYTDLNTSNAVTYGFNSSTPIVAYNQNGYVSISFHCKNIKSYPSISRDSVMSGIIQLDNSNKPISTITKSIKIALLDKDGNVLKVSDAVSVLSTTNNTFPRRVDYDASSTTPNIEFEQYYRGYLVSAINLSALVILAFLIRMVISTVIETLIAIPFKIRPLWKIVIVNIATQILLFALITFSGLSYANAIIIGEIFVFISEFVAYILLFKYISKPKLALYTVIANTSSLSIGLIFNYFHILIG
jgi:hypothetical protein